jgi:hypothetical protein
MPAIVERIFASHERVKNTQYFDDVLIAAKAFAKNYRLRVDNLVGLEIKMTMDLGENYPELLGFVDIAETEYDAEGPFIGITDFKTGWGSTVTDSYKFQRRLYGMMFRHHYPNERIGVRNHFVRPGIVTDYDMLTPWDYESTLAQTRAIVERMERAAQTGDYPATPNENCSWCVIAATCSVLGNLRFVGNTIATPTEAELAVRDVLVLDAAKSVRIKALKTYVNGNGPVLLDNGAMAGYTSPVPAPTITDVKRLMDLMGEDAYPLLRVDARELKKHADDSRLDDLWVESRPRPQFKVGKGKDDDDE